MGVPVLNQGTKRGGYNDQAYVGMNIILDIVGSIIFIALFMGWKELHWEGIKAVIKNNSITELGKQKRQERDRNKKAT
jgi:hypothetical protein